MEMSLGGVRGWLEPAVMCAASIWVLGSIVTNGKMLAKRTDRVLIGSTLFFLPLVFLGPDKYMNTLAFSQRWFPCCMILLLLALPMPVADKHVLRAFLACILALVAFGTARAWIFFERGELAGLQEAIAALPLKQKLLGLDLVKGSNYVKGRPFLQTFAYGQALREAELNFSFAEHASGIISYKTPPACTWTSNLEWFAERVTIQDILQFDYVLVNGLPEAHAATLAIKVLSPVTTDGRWRLYRTVRNNEKPR
jgi:hypothetical protein